MKGFRAALMLNAHQPTHQSVCVSQVITEILIKAALTLMNVLQSLVLMARIVSTKRVVSNVFALKDGQEMLTDQAVSIILVEAN